MTKKIITVFASILCLFALFLYVSFAGFPWTKWHVGNQILSYLESKYEEEFIIEDRFFNFKVGSYNIKVYPVNQPSMVFIASEGYGSYEFVDFYAEAIWVGQAEEDYYDLIEKLFSNKRDSNISTVMGEGVEIVKGHHIPNYKEANAFIHIGINIPERFQESEEEFTKMFDLITHIKQLGGNVHLFLSYEPEEDTKEVVYISFSQEEIKQITNLDDVIRFHQNND